MKSNFDFLNRYWPALAQIGATAETYVYSDPNACIYKLGMFAERLVQEILVFEHIAEPAVDNTHANRIRILKRAGLLPHEIDNTLYVLRKTRNSAVHIGTDSVDEAKTLLSLTYNLAVWFMEIYGDWGYIAPEFVMPSETTHEDLESVIAEQERKIEELTKQLAVVKTAASGKTQKERAKRSESVSAMMNWNEAQTRCLIDEQLRLSGWEANTQNLRYSKGTRPVKGRNIAISEWPTNSAFYKNGYADYAFFVGEKLVALLDAKKMSEDVASTIDVQVKDYAAHIKPEDIPHTVGNWNGYQVPFLFASNGRAYLEQLRTKSGIWFLDVREQENQPYPIRNWFSPSDLMEKLGQNTVAANQALAAADNSFMTDPNGLNLRDYQIKAIDKATEAIVDGKRTALLAMATGTGKTRTVLGLIYKMLESKRFRRILFLVDRVSLGEQAMGTFKDVKLKELLTLDKIYEIKAIDDNIINLETKVSISTVQGLLKRTILAEEPDLMPYLRPDAKSQVTIEYDDNGKPLRIDTIVVSTQHDEFIGPKGISQKEADEAMQKRIALDVKKILIPRVKAQYPAHVQALFNDNIIYHVNPTGKFVIGGPHGDTGLTGRKIIVDTYGGKGAHGGGAFSGKDPSKVDRSAAYAARHIAKNMVAAGVADEMLVQVSYAIGVAKPMNIFVNTFGRAKVNMTDGEIAAKIWDIFDMRPKAIEERLKLRNPIYFETASYGHMGRKPQTVTKTFSSRYLQKPVTCDVELFTWEKLDYADKIKDVFGL